MPAQDGAEALRAIPGFNVIRKGGTDGDPVLRGMAGSRLGILLDGEAILGGCGNRMDPPTAYVFPAAYDRITVLKGPQSVAHGPGNPAGVVLFERTPGRLTVSTASLQGSATFGSFDRNDQLLSARAGKPSGYVETTATRSASGDYDDGAGRKVHSRYERWSTHAAAAWTPDDTTLAELSAIASDGEAAYADRAMDGAAFTRKNLGLRLRRTGLSTALEAFEANLFVNAVDHVMDNYSLRPFTPSMMMPGRAVSNPDRLTYGGRAALKFTVAKRLHVTTGADYQSNRHRVRGTNDQSVAPYQARPRVRDASFEVAGIFAEATHEVSPSQRLVAGARGDQWRTTDHRETVATGMMGTAPNPTAHQKRAQTLRSGFLRYEHDLAGATTAFVGLGHAQRFPDYWELFSKESRTSISAFDTRAERTTQLDLGLTRRTTRLVASVSLFASRVSDSILVETGVIKPAGMMGTRTATVARNIDTQSWGGEASLLYRFENGLRAELSAASVRGTNRTDARALAQQPPLEGRFGLSYSNTRWTVGALSRFVAAQERFALNQGNIVGQDLGRTAGFAIFSLNAGWKPAAWGELAVGVDNLLDRDHAEHLSRGGSMVAGFPPTTRVNEPGRTWWLKTVLRW
jgi:iron complex outermembrane receptor protein